MVQKPRSTGMHHFYLPFRQVIIGNGMARSNRQTGDKIGGPCHIDIPVIVYLYQLKFFHERAYIAGRLLILQYLELEQSDQ